MSDENKHVAEAFNQYIKSLDGQELLVKQFPGLKNTVRQYQHLENILKEDGSLSERDQNALGMVVKAMSNQIELQGAASFGEVKITEEEMLK